MRNIEEANRMLTEKPIFATAAERFLILHELMLQNKDLPQPLRFSKTLGMLLSRVSLPLEEYDLIAGRCLHRELTEEEERLFAEFITSPEYPSKTFFFPSGHCTYSWDLLLKEGLVGLRVKAAHKLTETEDAQKRIFLSAMVEMYDSIIAFAHRYADAAKEKGMTAVAENLEKAATVPPDSFVSALQLLWLVTLINCGYVSENPTLTVGRLDQLLYPFYVSDLQSGALTEEKAREYITDYYCKHNLIMGRGEHQVGDRQNSTTFKRIPCFDAPQYLLLAGTDESGKPAENELTDLFAECIVPSFKNPVVVVRYVKDMDKRSRKLWRTLCEKALASSSLMFYNDENVSSTFRRIGLPPEDASRYAHFGCNWCSPGDNSAWMAGAPQSKHFDVCRTPEEIKTVDVPFMRANSKHSWPEDFMTVLRELAKKDPDAVSIEDFYGIFFARMADFIDRKLAMLDLDLTIRKKNPSSAINLGDCFHTAAIESSQCHTASAKYHFGLLPFQMFGTVADCFIAVDQLVMIEKKLTLTQLLEATEANFEGYSDVLALCRKADKYGMDTPLSNKHVKRLSHTASELIIEKSKPYFLKEKLFLVPAMQSDTWHLKYGEKYGATPDGRLAHTPYSQNSKPTNGVCSAGLTAMLNSMLNLPHDGLVSGALNLDVDPKQFAGDRGPELFSALLASYFNRGGLHAQVSATSADELIDAQKNPHLHRDLRVRVTGYSGVFVDFCEKLQNDVIDRVK